MKRIVTTTHAGGVLVTTPTPWAMRWLACGGFWGSKPRGWYDHQIESQIARGVKPDAARRYVKAMISGGCSMAEAHAIIRDRDCGHLGSAHELWDSEDLPDRWFRDAWVRGHNGGPIDIDLEKARPLQWNRIWSASLLEKPKWNGVAFDPASYRSRIREARSCEELRAVWPEGVPQ